MNKHKIRQNNLFLGFQVKMHTMSATSFKFLKTIGLVECRSVNHLLLYLAHIGSSFGPGSFKDITLLGLSHLQQQLLLHNKQTLAILTP